jgi:hypothetical protein
MRIKKKFMQNKYAQLLSTVVKIYQTRDKKLNLFDWYVVFLFAVNTFVMVEKKIVNWVLLFFYLES